MELFTGRPFKKRGVLYGNGKCLFNTNIKLKPVYAF